MAWPTRASAVTVSSGTMAEVRVPDDGGGRGR
jgi:hypothetical protein